MLPTVCDHTDLKSSLGVPLISCSCEIISVVGGLAFTLSLVITYSYCYKINVISKKSQSILNFL
ncbi:hypothetical protein LCUFL03_230048 [Latilactobacillus curvatus]|nr:hypothetical protein LCUFL03_230048 [Latilactobacillus curvatus]